MSITNVIYKSDLFSRVTEVSINGKRLITPTYFPAVSSYGIKYQFDALVRLLITYSYPRLLISAYDFHLLDNKSEKLAREIGEYSKKGCVVFLDSGIYESFWKADDKWSYDLYRNSISQVNFDFYSSFDVLPYAEDLGLKFSRDTLENILASRKLSDKLGFVPILHGRSPDELVSLVTMLMKEHPHLCDFIAIPERDCGDDVVAKAKTIVKIRKLLDKDDHGRILHILGCGNPISLILFSYCGADMFDSLDWIKYVIDQNRLIVRDSSHLELTNCECAICSGIKRNYIEKVLLHNLLFYQNYMLQIQLLIRRDEISEFLTRRIGQDIVKKIRRFGLKFET
mgnify:CR=1 FL=1